MEGFKMIVLFILLYLGITFDVYAQMEVPAGENTTQRIWNSILWPAILFMFCLDNVITYLEKK
jgi:hypothetical protein